MGDTTFRATWDDTGSAGVVNLTNSELKEFTTSAGSDKGEHITFDVLIITFLLILCALTGDRREILMETDDLAFKLRLRFDICCMALEERGVPQIEEDLSVLYYRSMCHIFARSWHYLISGACSAGE